MKDLKLHRTKCSGIINHVLGPMIHEQRVHIVWAMVHNVQGMMCPALEVASALKGPGYDLSHDYRVNLRQDDCR